MNLVVEKERVRVESRDFPVNQGGLCQKGWTAADLLSHPDRLTSPLLRDRKDAPLRKATWDEALDHIAAEVHRLQEQFGKNAVGMKANSPIMSRTIAA